MTLDTMGKRLAIARKTHTPKMTQKDLACLSGVKQATISRIESGQIEETKYVVELAKAVNVHIEWLKSGFGTMRPISSNLKEKMNRLEKTINNMNLSNDELDRIIDIAIIEASKINSKK